MALSILRHKGILNKHLVHNIWMPVFCEHSDIEEQDEWIRLLNKMRLLKMQVMLMFFAITVWKYSFVNFLSIFYSFQCLYIVRFEWDIVLSSSYDGWDKRGYTILCPREGTSSSTVSKGGAKSADVNALGFYF